ncbi:MAG TPA: hypothetical protein DEA96_02950 [Leptospiraceae bacterium]|nr:hypothetical protein [Spirochaetaceae bacterium]HBS03896.1 hypothetical protein [Leptospiraceae bacterium]|tara:strand:- start:10127 stop:11455 length:1329 start_codon:yes stop_codon:yes gene_type:complete
MDEKEKQSESPILRNLSFAVLFLAGALSLWQKAEHQPPEEAQNRFRTQQMEFFLKIQVSLVVLPEIADEYMQDPEEARQQALDSLKQICDLDPNGNARAGIQCAVLTAYLDADYEKYIRGSGPLQDQFQSLYVEKKPLNPEAELFQTAVGDLVRLRQYELQGKTERAQELRERLRQHARESYGSQIAVVLAVLGILTMGLVFVVAAVRKKPVQQYGIALMSLHPGDYRVLLEGTILAFFGITALLPVLGGLIPSDFRIHGMVGGHFLLLLGILYYVVRQSSPDTLQKIIGDWHYRPAHQLFIGFLGWCAIVPVGIIATMAMMQSAAGDPVEQAHPIAFILQDHFVLAFILAVVLAPIMEEIVFRGFLYGYLRRYFSILSAAPITGFIFAILHPQGYVALPYLFMLGTGLCLMREYNRSMIPAVFAHMVTNGLVMIISYAMLH